MSSSIPATAPPSAFDAFVAEPDSAPHAEDLNGGYRADQTAAQPIEQRDPVSAFGAELFAFGSAMMHALQPTITIDRAAAHEDRIRRDEWLADYQEGHR